MCAESWKIYFSSLWGRKSSGDKLVQGCEEPYVIFWRGWILPFKTHQEFAHEVVGLCLCFGGYLQWQREDGFHAEERQREKRQRLLKQPKQERMKACARTESVRMESWTGLERGSRNSRTGYAEISGVKSQNSPKGSMSHYGLDVVSNSKDCGIEKNVRVLVLVSKRRYECMDMLSLRSLWGD